MTSLPLYFLLIRMIAIRMSFLVYMKNELFWGIHMQQVHTQHTNENVCIHFKEAGKCNHKLLIEQIEKKGLYVS